MTENENIDFNNEKIISDSQSDFSAQGEQSSTAQADALDDASKVELQNNEETVVASSPEIVASNNALAVKSVSKYAFINKYNAWKENVSKNMPRWLKRTLEFMSHEWLYFAVPILIFALFFSVLYSLDIFPFSNDNMSNYDLLAQIVPFYEHFYDVIDGKSSLFYSPAIAGGADVFGTLAYCAVSPFTFVFLLFGRTQVYNAISFILPLKLSCIACAAIWFIKRNFKNVNESQTLIISIIYAFCGYMFVANTYVNWLDFLIYMPFVITGFKTLVLEKKIRFFAISYALMIYACFSIACFALLSVFLICVAYVLLVCEKQDRWDTLARICVSLVVAVGLALPIIVPSFFAYIRSGRNTGLFENMENPLNSDHIYAKFSYIISDSLFMFFTIAYFVKNGFKDKLNRFLLVAGVILMMPIFIDEVCNLLNAGSYMSYALRFGFLTAGYGLFITAKFFNSVKDDKKKVNGWINGAFTAVMILLAAFAIVFILDLNNKITEGNYSSSSPLSDFSGLFAHSLGGLEVMYQISFVLFALFMLGSLLYIFKLIRLKNITYVLIAVLAVEVAFFNIHVVRGNNFNPLRYDQFNAAFEKVDDYDDRRYYKVKDNTATITSNFSLNMHMNSYGLFSSVIDRDNFVATNFFNYEGNQTNSVETSGGSFFADSLLGYKYFFVHTDETNKYLMKYREYCVKLEETAQLNFCAYENIGVFPNCYTVDSGVLKMDSNNKVKDIDELYKFIGGKGSAFIDVTFKDVEQYESNDKVEEIIDEETGIKYYAFELNTRCYGEYYLDVDLPSEYDVYYNTSTSSDVKNLEYYKLENKGIWLNYSQPNSGVFHLNIKAVGDKQLDMETVQKYVHGKILSNDTVLELSDYLDTRACSYTQKRDKFTINATAENSDTYLLLNYVSIDGFKATVNGHKAEVIDNGIEFLLVKLDKGENVVVFDYDSPYVKFIILGIALGAIIVAAMYLVMKKFTKIYEKCRPIICVLAIVLAIGVAGFFFIYPTSLFLTKLFKLLGARF